LVAAPLRIIVAEGATLTVPVEVLVAPYRYPVPAIISVLALTEVLAEKVLVPVSVNVPDPESVSEPLFPDIAPLSVWAAELA
jgi:hypothetical protein